MSPEDALSTTALIISLVALIVALAQAFQQYFSTAEGFRRCRKDVIGSWSSLNQAPFDWRHLRFEVRFASPHLSLANPRDFYHRKEGDDEEVPFDALRPIGHKELPPRTVDSGTLPSARVSWLALLEHMWSYQEGVWYNAFERVPVEQSSGVLAEKGEGREMDLNEWFEWLNKNADGALTLPAARKRMVSWDFMPPDAMKPFAVIDLHDLLILGHRLGLDWASVDPLGDDVKLTAQDDYGNDITGSSIRGLGLVVQFRHDSGLSELDKPSRPGRRERKVFSLEHIMVPSAEADKLAFGIIPGDRRLELDDVLVATREDCLEYVSTLDENQENLPRDARELLQRSFDTLDNTKTGLDQLMPLISPCLVLPGCQTTNVRKPNDWCQIGILEVMEAFIVFRERIKTMAEAQETSSDRKAAIVWIQGHWKYLADTFGPFVWAAMRLHGNKAKLSTETAKVHNECTERLEGMMKKFLQTVAKHCRGERPPGVRPMQTMLRFHIWRALRLREQAAALERSQINTYGLPFQDAPMFCGMMHIQMDHIDDLAEEVVRNILGREASGELEKENHEVYRALVDDMGTAWLVWIFRALVFNRSATFVEPRRPGAGGRPYQHIASRWLYSNIPVHIV